VTSGPFDFDDAPQDIDYLDLGALKIPIIDEAQVQLNFDQSIMRGVGASIVLKNSMLDLQLFARAKDEYLWPEIRTELTEALTEQGVEHEIVIGTFGPEVRAVMPLIDSEGNNVLQSVRFVGVDGNRWFLRIAISGAAAVSENEIAKMDRVISQITIARGPEPMAPGELITLDVPEVEESVEQ